MNPLFVIIIVFILIYILFKLKENILDKRKVIKMLDTMICSNCKIDFTKDDTNVYFFYQKQTELLKPRLDYHCRHCGSQFRIYYNFRKYEKKFQKTMVI